MSIKALMTNYEDASTLVFNYIDYNVLKTIAELELLIGNMRLAGASNQAILAVITEFVFSKVLA